MDGQLADPIAGADLACVARELGRGVVLVRPNAKTRDDLGLASLPHSYSRGRHSIYALDRAGVGREAGPAFRQRRYLRACGPDLGGDLVHVVGANPSRTLLVERDYAQGRSPGH